MRDVPGVPDYDAVVRRARHGDALVVVPVLNEGERIRQQLGRMGELGLPSHRADLVIADGGSNDGSLDEASLQAGDVRAVLVKRGPGALSAQLRTAIHWAMQEGYEHVVTIDGNGKDGVDGVLTVLTTLRAGYDYVQGSRYVEGGVAINTPRSRHWAVKLVHAPLLSLGARHRFTDTTNGLRGWSMRALADPAVAPLRDVFATYNLHYYLTVRVPRLGYPSCEVPVTRAYPAKGQIPTKIGGAGAKLDIVRDAARAAAGRYNPH